MTVTAIRVHCNSVVAAVEELKTRIQEQAYQSEYLKKRDLKRVNTLHNLAKQVKELSALAPKKEDTQARIVVAHLSSILMQLNQGR